MNKTILSRIIVLLSLILGITAVSAAVSAEEKDGEYLSNRYGMSFISGRTYDPTNNIDFYMVSGFIMYDYEKVWKHEAPEQLRFKVETSLGIAYENDARFTGSVNIFAHYYLEEFKCKNFKPYIEGGVGVIYTDFQVEGQGLRWNFNPQLGIGTEIKSNGDTFFVTVRAHHISNAGLDDDNRGVNSVMLMVGYYF